MSEFQFQATFFLNCNQTASTFVDLFFLIFFNAFQAPNQNIAPSYVHSRGRREFEFEAAVKPLEL